MVARKKKAVIDGVAERVDEAPAAGQALVMVVPGPDAIAAAYEREPGVPSEVTWAELEGTCRALTITGPDDKSGYKAVVSAVNVLRKIRAAIERRRVELKKPALQYERALDAYAATLQSRVDDLQTPLSARRAEIDAEIAEAKAAEERRLLAAKLEAERLAREEAERAEAAARARLAEEEKRRAALEAELAALRAGPAAPAEPAAAEVLEMIVDAAKEGVRVFASDQFLTDFVPYVPDDLDENTGADFLADVPDPLLLAWSKHLGITPDHAVHCIQSTPKRYAEFSAGWLACARLFNGWFTTLPAEIKLSAPVGIRCAVVKGCTSSDFQGSADE